MGDLQFRSLPRNVSLYPLYQVFYNAYFWLPVFFLYFSEHLSLERVLQLEAIYYATVVVLEVPSGYFSDTVGRRCTLLISATALAASYALFFFGPALGIETFAVFALAQVCLAVGISFNSGTDTALHFDSLSALQRADEYADREAAAHRYALLGRAVAALGGGVAAMWGLRLAYGLSLLGAVGLLIIVALLVEPSKHVETPESVPAGGFLRQIRACLGRLTNPSLAWLMGFAVLMIVINHVPYELYQPYLDLLVEERGFDLPGEETPLLTGIVTAATLVVASWAAGRSIRIRNRIGLAPTLLATTLLQVVIMVAMALVLHEAVLVLILLRSVPAAVMEPPMRGAIVPQLPRSLRATYLSLQSLAGRLAFAVTLLALAQGAAPEAPPDWPAVSSMSLVCATVGGAGLVLLAVTARFCLGRMTPVGNRLESGER
ncbi:MAG: MFS transporter [Planctomycetota bacterium]|jgi:MFS family permease